MKTLRAEKQVLITLLAFAVAAAIVGQAAAEELPLPQPTALQVIGRQCGQPPVSNIATGFDGAYAFSFAESTTRCSTGGRGSRPRTYHGCATVRYTLSGRLVDVIHLACSPQDTSAIYTNDAGYREYTSAAHAFLTLPDVLPTYSWQDAGEVSAPLGAVTPFSATLVNDSAVPLYVYSFSAHANGSAIYVEFDSTPCTDVTLQPGEACVVPMTVAVSEEATGVQSVALSAETNARSEVSGSQTIQPVEVDAPPPPEPVVTGATVLDLGAGVCDAALTCALVPTDQTIITSGQLDLTAGTLTLENADRTRDTAPLAALDILPLGPDVTMYSLLGTASVYDSNGNVVKTIELNAVLGVTSDGTAYYIASGTLSVTTFATP